MDIDGAGNGADGPAAGTGRGRCPGQRGPALLLVAVRGGKCHRVCMRASERAGAAGVPALAGGAPGGMVGAARAPWVMVAVIREY